MANIFTITTAAQNLKADANGSVTTVFTVTNATSRPIRGIARIKPLSNTQAQWLKIDGETERDFPAGGTHQFTVSFNKPKLPTSPNTPQPAESFPFRFDVASATNPDEDFTEGPVVTVEIAEQKVEEKKPFPWWILIVIGVLLIVGAIVAFLLLRPDPNENVANTATPTPTQTPTPTPAVTRVVYNFIEKAPSAVWKTSTGSGKVNFLDGSSNDSTVLYGFGNGSVRIFKDEPMENGNNEDKVIGTQAGWSLEGSNIRSITGTYELLEPIDAKDRFRAKIGFLKPTVGGNYKVAILLNEVAIAELTKTYDGTLREFKFDLGDYKGESGRFALQAIALNAQGGICWVNPRIERVP